MLTYDKLAEQIDSGNVEGNENLRFRVFYNLAELRESGNANLGNLVGDPVFEYLAWKNRIDIENFSEDISSEQSAIERLMKRTMTEREYNEIKDFATPKEKISCPITYSAEEPQKDLVYEGICAGIFFGDLPDQFENRTMSKELYKELHRDMRNLRNNVTK